MTCPQWLRTAARIVVFTLAIGCCLAAGSCPPSPVTRTINLSGASFPLGSVSNSVDHTFTFFAGNGIQTFQLNVSLTGLTGTTCSVDVVAGGGRVLQTITTNGTGIATTPFPGNVGRLHVKCAGLVAPPGLAINSITETTTGTAAIPEIVSTVSDQVASLPLTLNSPVELGMPSTSGKFFYFVASGLASKTVDIVLDGSGVVTFNAPERGFDIGASNPDGRLSSLVAGASATITMPATRDSLLLTVTNNGAEGHTRFSVNVPTSILSLQARFAIPFTRATAVQVAALIPAIDAANRDLYRTTVGHVRVGSLTVYTGLTTGGDSSRDDIRILPAAGGQPAVVGPDHRIVFDMAGPPGPTTNGSDLGLAILERKFSLPREPLDVNGANLCPNSFMANSRMVLPTLCWRANHNPFGSNLLGAATGASMWEKLAPQIGMTAPTVSPENVLRNLSGVTFGVTTTTDP